LHNYRQRSRPVTRADGIEEFRSAGDETLGFMLVADDDEDGLAVSTFQFIHAAERVSIERVCAESVKSVRAKSYDAACGDYLCRTLTRFFAIFNDHRIYLTLTP